MTKPSPAHFRELDRAVIERLTASVAAEGVVEIIDAYLKDETKLLNGLREALRRKDVMALKLHTHTLKSTSAMLGASVLAKVCEELETDARAGAVEWTDSLLNEIESRYQVVKSELEAERRRLSR